MQSALCRAAVHTPVPVLSRRLSTTAVLGRSSRGSSPRLVGPRPRNPLAQALDTASNTTTRSKGSYQFPPGVQPLGPGRSASQTYDAFKRLVVTRINLLLGQTEGWNNKSAQWSSFGLNSVEDFNKEIALFRLAVEKACDLASSKRAVTKTANPLFFALRKAFVENDTTGLGRELVYNFQNFLMRTKFPKNIVATQQAMADFRYPYEWFPATRAMQRTIHLHVGPTNSGKTYNALKALENARTGIYAGPLRLLAHEIYSRFVAKGKSCALVTGEEQRIPTDADSYFRSCTVEMTPLNHPVDVAVIDEIQMIADSERGWAWTQAVLGVQAREVHLCGEERSVDLIKSICATTGDKLVIHNYERLSPLKTMDHALGGYQNLEKGDCVVTFSRVGIHSLKKTIEARTGRRVAIVYGSLPPETRAQQAALFNDPNNDYDFLVASDAIGMGLNLEIKRVIFEQVHKRTAVTFRQMEISEIKQIGGRAGRFRTAAHAIQAGTTETNKGGDPPAEPPKQIGLVTTVDPADLKIVQRAFSQDAEQLKTAGIQPPPAILERFSSYFPRNVPLTYILARLRDIAQVSPRYHVCATGEQLTIANLIQPFPMPIYDRCVFLNAPVFLREDDGIKILQAYARCVSTMNGGHLLDIPEIRLEILDEPKEADPFARAQQLRRLETLHKAITLYLWLSYRYSGVFHSQHLAFHVKEMVETLIDEHLGEVAESDSQRKKRLKIMRKTVEKAQRKKTRLVGDRATIDANEDQHHEVPGDWNEPGHEEPLYEDKQELQDAVAPTTEGGSK